MKIFWRCAIKPVVCGLGAIGVGCIPLLIVEMLIRSPEWVMQCFWLVLGVACSWAIGEFLLSLKGEK